MFDAGRLPDLDGLDPLEKTLKAKKEKLTIMLLGAYQPTVSTFTSAFKDNP